MLDVVIVGAGIAGLSAGISLRRAGHVVRIYERSAMDNEVGAAINVSPNAAKFLTRWGLDPKASKFVKAESVHFQDPVTMEIMSTLSHDANEEFYDADLWYAHRVDLHDALKRIATQPAGPGVPVTIHPNSRVVGYNPELPAVHLQDGEEIQCDLVVGADGIQSIASETVLGQKMPLVAPLLYNCCFRFLIPADVLEEDSETKFWNEDSSGLIRLFPDNEKNRRIGSYPCRNNTIHNFVGILYDEKMKDAIGEDYQTDVDKAELLERFNGFHPSLLAIINKATEIKRWPLLSRAPLATWRKEEMVIIGDAAHPMLPHQGQAGSMSLEDGLALGVVFAGVSDTSDVEKRLELFEKIRRSRASAIQILSNVGTDQTSLVEKDLLEFVPADEIPKNPQENVAFTFGYNVVDEAIKVMEEFDPSFHVPYNFFEDDFFDINHVNGELSKMSELGFIKVETCISIDTE
ncbi:FAD binding domain-containing protein [Colletotrichum orchidophilum]|uniref:FAD binding domain-containing protein n=1 Tax=Colletotrichum orchidophilum TaxID=1209926 RepID=A0A1G4BRK4_9PEZI|nr:FAD binding domain-containing protein [Colletotrichum orchidophilum]OHF03926.1 FAD binding domain-containing protein [Colletotrichum orchidophilum]